MQLFPRIKSQTLGNHVREHKINKLIVSPNKRFIQHHTQKDFLNITRIQPQNSKAKESKATSEIESTWKEGSSLHGLLAMLTCSPHALSDVSVTVPAYWPWHAPKKIKRGGHFGVLTGMWFFQNITLHRASNSAKSQAQIKFAFHFVKRNHYFWIN